MVDLSEIAGKAGYYGTRCALIRESRNGLRPKPGGALKLYAIRKSLIYKYICRKMIYFAIKTA